MWQWRPPASGLERIRLVAVSIGSVAVLSQLGQLGNVLRSPAYLHLSAAAVVGLFVVMAVTYHLGRSAWWTVPLVPVLIVLGGSGLRDSLSSMSFSLGTMIVLSLYGSTRMWAARFIGALAAVMGSVAVSPNSIGRVVTWDSPVMISMLPQVALVAVMTRGIYLAMLRHERAARREGLLARAGHAMIGCTDQNQIRGVARQAARELAALTLGTPMIVLRRDECGLRIASVVGHDADLSGTIVPDDVIVDPSPLVALLPDFPRWRVDSLGTQGTGTEVLIAVGARKAVNAEALDAFRTLSHQVLLAEKACQVHAELDHLAHHDHLTQLPTRAKFFRTLAAAIGSATPGTVALLNVDLDEFKQVNDTYGHAAGDELLVEMASRMAQVARGRGLAGRFGGDEFALLLTGLTGHGQAQEIAELLSARLAEPVRLSAATVRVGASIGIAAAEPGITVAELTRRADMAMYTAKAAGKNRVEAFRGEIAHLVS
jgi:diguanylate cyclase (GGDEF)-like protein